MVEQKPFRLIVVVPCYSLFFMFIYVVIFAVVVIAINCSIKNENNGYITDRLLLL